MATQSEQALEKNLIHQLELLGFERIHIKGENALIANLKLQLGEAQQNQFI